MKSSIYLLCTLLSISLLARNPFEFVPQHHQRWEEPKLSKSTKPAIQQNSEWQIVKEDTYETVLKNETTGDLRCISRVPAKNPPT